jgi:hypothetical protein
MKQSRDEKILWEIYRELFKQSEPSGDFDLLVENAEIDEHGKKHIPYNDYVIDLEEMDKIIETILRKYRIPVWRRPSYRFAIYLGCSPKTKIKDDSSKV